MSLDPSQLRAHVMTMVLMRACGVFLLMFGLTPGPAHASPEVLLAIGGPSTSSDASAPLGFPLGPDPEAVVHFVHEGDVVPLPTCDAPLHVGLRASTDKPTERQALVRLMKRRLSRDACEIEVLAIASTGSGALDGSRLPCGTQLIQIRETRSRATSGSVNGRKPTDICADVDSGMESPLNVYWMDSTMKGNSASASARDGDAHLE